MKKIIMLLLIAVLMSDMTVQTFAMQIFVKNYDGQDILGSGTVTLEVEPDDTIATIKAKLLEKTGIATKQQKLFWNDREIADDTKTLDEYGIVRESTLKLDISLLNSPMNDGDVGTYYLGVSGAYTPGINAADVVSVDIEWEAMNFTYTDGALGTWYPESHSYSGGTAGSWSNDKASITVTNHSNVGIDATFDFTPANGMNINGKFYASADATTALTTVEQKLSLATAVGTELTNAPMGTFYFGISGDAISENKVLGNITVTIAKE